MSSATSDSGGGLLCYGEVTGWLTGFLQGRVTISEFVDWFELARGTVPVGGGDGVKDLMFAIGYRLGEWEHSARGESEVKMLLACELGGQPLNT